MHSLKVIYWQLVKRILRYLEGSLNNCGLLFKRPHDLSLVGFADADWASDPNDQKSTIGFCVFFGGN